MCIACCTMLTLNSTLPTSGTQPITLFPLLPPRPVQMIAAAVGTSAATSAILLTLTNAMRGPSASPATIMMPAPTAPTSGVGYPSEDEICRLFNKWNSALATLNEGKVSETQLPCICTCRICIYNCIRICLAQPQIADVICSGHAMMLDRVPDLGVRQVHTGMSYHMHDGTSVSLTLATNLRIRWQICCDAYISQQQHAVRICAWQHKHSHTRCHSSPPTHVGC